MNELSSISIDLMKEIAFKLDYPDIISWCSTNTKFKEKTCDKNKFWLQRLLKIYNQNPSIAKELNFKLYVDSESTLLRTALDQYFDLENIGFLGLLSLDNLKSSISFKIYGKATLYLALLEDNIFIPAYNRIENPDLKTFESLYQSDSILKLAQNNFIRKIYINIILGRLKSLFNEDEGMMMWSVYDPFLKRWFQYYNQHKKPMVDISIVPKSIKIKPIELEGVIYRKRV